MMCKPVGIVNVNRRTQRLPRRRCEQRVSTQSMQSPLKVRVPYTSVIRIGVSIQQDKAFLLLTSHQTTRNLDPARTVLYLCPHRAPRRRADTERAFSWSQSLCTTHPGARSCCKPLRTRGAYRRPSARATPVGEATLQAVRGTSEKRPLSNSRHVGQRKKGGTKERMPYFQDRIHRRPRRSRRESSSASCWGQ